MTAGFVAPASHFLKWLKNDLSQKIPNKKPLRKVKLLNFRWIDRSGKHRLFFSAVNV
jgi:hypothetical protein